MNKNIIRKYNVNIYNDNYKIEKIDNFSMVNEYRGDIYFELEKNKRSSYLKRIHIFKCSYF